MADICQNLECLERSLEELVIQWVAGPAIGISITPDPFGFATLKSSYYTCQYIWNIFLAEISCYIWFKAVMFELMNTFEPKSNLIALHRWILHNIIYNMISPVGGQYTCIHLAGLFSSWREAATGDSRLGQGLNSSCNMIPIGGQYIWNIYLPGSAARGDLSSTQWIPMYMIVPEYKSINYYYYYCNSETAVTLNMVSLTMVLDGVNHLY